MRERKRGVDKGTVHVVTRSADLLLEGRTLGFEIIAALATLFDLPREHFDLWHTRASASDEGRHGKLVRSSRHGEVSDEAWVVSALM